MSIYTHVRLAHYSTVPIIRAGSSVGARTARYTKLFPPPSILNFLKIRRDRRWKGCFGASCTQK